MEEVHMVVRVARRYHQLKLHFCIITFYDPQRAAIINALENEDLPSDCVYNVDSFQGMWRRSPRSISPNRRSTWVTGNEADYVILSSVRTKQPGFLKSQPRMNVALTRCRKGMVVVTDKSFLQGAGRSTLLGQLCSTWSRQHEASWIDSKAMLNNSGALPGLRPPAPPSQLSRNGIYSPSLSGRTTMPPRNPPSHTPSLPQPQARTQTQTQTRTYRDQVPSSARAALSPGFVRSVHRFSSPETAAAARIILGLSNPANYQRRGGGGGGGHGHGSAWSVGTVRRDLNNDEFPSLQPLATALESAQSSLQHNRKGRR